MVGDFMASEGSPLLLEDEVVTLAVGGSSDFQFVEIDIGELPHRWEGGEYHHLYSSMLDIAEEEEELAAVNGEGVLNPSSPSTADYYVMEELIDDSSSSSSYRSLFDVEVVDVSEYQLSPPGGGEHVYPLMSKELLSLRQQLLDDHFPSRAARYAPDSSSSSSSSASSYFRYSSDLGLTFSGNMSSCLSIVSIVLLVVLVACIVVFLPFGDPRGMAREWMRMRCDRAGAATGDDKSKRKTAAAALSMSLADAIFLLGCAADQLQSMHCSWYDASTTDANTSSSSSISLRTLRLLATTLERELSLGVGLEPHHMHKRTRRRSEFILSKLAVLLTKLNRDKDAMNRRLALHTCSSSSSSGGEEDMHVDDRIELFLRTNELSCVVEDLSAARHRIVTLQEAGSECRHLLAVVDCLKAAMSARDVS